MVAKLPSYMGRDRFRFGEEGYVCRCPRGCKPIVLCLQNPNGEGVHLHAYFEGDKAYRVIACSCAQTLAPPPLGLVEPGNSR